MRHCLSILLIAFGCVGMAALMDQSVEDGLFGVIVGVGFYLVSTKGTTT